MAPSSKNTEMCSDIDDTILKISETFGKIQLETETSTYNIDDENENENEDETETKTSEEIEDNLDDCATIQEKGLKGSEKYNNNRYKPFDRTSNDRRQNNNYQNNINNYQEVSFNHPDFNEILTSLLNDEFNEIPAPVLDINSPPIQTHVAQKQLSDFIDTKKKLKQDIWILVNIEDEYKLLTKLRNKIQAQSFNDTDLNYIYAIIIRLMKDDNGRHLLMNYLSNENVLIKIALKQNILLMNFLLEIYYNNQLNINNQAYILHEIINQQQIDSSAIFEILINYKLNNNNYMFDVNLMDQNGETILMVLMKYIGIDKSRQQNIKYLNLVLSRYPDITCTTSEGRNIFHFAFSWSCDDYVVQKIKMNYDETTVNYLMYQMDVKGYYPANLKPYT